MNQKHRYHLVISSIAISFVIWAALFIYRSSFIAIDGRRYFSLFEDAMISMRYAWNFSHGLGLVWNPGEYVEGYTNLLMVLFMSLMALIFDDKSIAVLAVQISGIVFMLGSAYFTMLITDHISLGESEQHRSLLRLFSFVCTLAYYPLVYWSLMGMETGLLAFLLLLATLSALRYLREQRMPHLFLMSLSLGLAYLTRPDSLIATALIFSYLFYEMHQSKSTRLYITSLLGAVGMCILFVVGQEIFRWNYYGEPVPNTYTLKLTGMPILTRIMNGLGFIWLYLLTGIGFLSIVGIGLIRNFQRQKLFLVSITIAYICYQVWVGGDPWRYWRIMAPSMPLMLAVCVLEIITIVRSLSNTTIFRRFSLQIPIQLRRYASSSLIFLLIATVLAFVNARFLSQITFISRPDTAWANQQHVNIALTLERITTKEATVGVFWAGTTPYYVDRVAIDFWGRSDKYIAQLPPDLSGAVSWGGMFSVPGHNKYDLDYSIKTLQPDYVQTTYVSGFKWGKQDISDWAQSHYVTVECNGITFALLKDSKNVLWDEIIEPKRELL